MVEAFRNLLDVFESKYNKKPTSVLMGYEDYLTLCDEMRKTKEYGYVRELFGVPIKIMQEKHGVHLEVNLCDLGSIMSIDGESK